MASPLRIPPGTVLRHDGIRIVFVEEIDDYVLRFVIEGSEEEFLVAAGEDVRVRATVKWVLDEFAAGRLESLGTSEATLAEWRGRFLGLDRGACLAKQPRAVTKYDLALAAIIRGLPRNADVLETFADNFLPKKEPRPSGRSIIRWMNNLQLHEERIGALCNRSGREKGRSQLPPIADRLVQQSVGLYFGVTALKKMDANALATTAWRMLKDQGVEGLGDKAPSKTTVVNRINKCENMETWISKWGPHDANRHFLASGESAVVKRPFDLVYIDGMEMEQVSLFTSEMPIPSNKLKVIQTIDAHSLFAFPSTPFAGPYRSEMGMNSLLGVLEPPVLDDETRAENPMHVLFFGRIGLLRGDNDKAIIPPSAIGNLAGVIRRVELAKKFGPDDKSPIENYIGFVKQRLDGEPGTVLSPRSRKRSIRRDPLAEAYHTRGDFARKYEGLRLEWNATGHEAIGWRTPNDVMLEHVMTYNVRFTKPGEVRRHLARTVIGVLTTDGVVFDDITYRFNRTGVTRLLSENLASQEFAKRLDGTARCEVWLRVYDWNLDFVEVLNESNNEFVTLWSDDPDYTEFLSRYEHRFHKDNQISGATGAQTAEEKALVRGRTLQRELSKLEQGSYGVAKKAAAVLECAEVRANARNIDGDPDLTNFEHFLIPTDVAGGDRADIPQGPSQSRAGRNGKDENGEDASSQPPMADDQGGLDPASPSDLHLLSQDEEDDPDEGINWDEVDGEEPHDPATDGDDT